jgi:hypothetical protein
MFLAVLVFTDILDSIDKGVSALAMFLVVLPFTNILGSTGIGISAVTIMKPSALIFWAGR